MKLRLRWADSRFAEPQSFLERENGFILFALCKKNQKAHEVCRPGRDKLSMQWKVSKTAKPPIMAQSAKLCCGSNKDNAAKGGGRI